MSSPPPAGNSCTSSKYLYKTTASDYDPLWSSLGAFSVARAPVPKVSEVLSTKPRAPAALQVDLTPFVNLKLAADMERSRLADRVLSAHTVPVKFPVKAEHISYPTSALRGCDNPLYQSSSSAIGSEQPRKHQLAERFFPKNNHFSKGFTVQNAKSTALSTRLTRSRIHAALDKFY
jgi:hypothetical protein